MLLPPPWKNCWTAGMKPLATIRGGAGEMTSASERSQMSHECFQLLAVVRLPASRLDEGGLRQCVEPRVAGEAGQNEPVHLPIWRVGSVETCALGPVHHGVQRLHALM